MFISNTYWGRMTHICISKISIIGSDNGLSPDGLQATVSTNAGILLTWPLGTHFRDIVIGIHTLPFQKMQLKISSGEWRPFCLDLNLLKWWPDSGLVYFRQCHLLDFIAVTWHLHLITDGNCNCKYLTTMPVSKSFISISLPEQISHFVYHTSKFIFSIQIV